MYGRDRPARAVFMSDYETPYDDSVCYACGVDLPEPPERRTPAWQGFCSRVCERVGRPISQEIPKDLDLDEAYALGDGEEAIVYWQSSPHFNGWYLNILIDNTGYMHQLPTDGPYPSKWRADFAGQDAAQTWLYEAEGYWAPVEDLPVPLNDPGRHGPRGDYLEGWDRY